MSDYERRVRLTLTAAEAAALEAAARKAMDWVTDPPMPAREYAALGRAWAVLDAARSTAARRNAEKATQKRQADTRSEQGDENR